MPPATRTPPPSSPGTGRGPWFLLHCGEDPRSSLRGRSLCVWWWWGGGGGAEPRTRRCSRLGAPLPASRKAPGSASSSGQRAGTVHPAAGAEEAGAGPALSPRPQRALLCSSASAIDSPLPLSGRWQRSPENGRGRGGPEAFTPRPAACPARSLLARARALLPALPFRPVFPSFLPLSVGANWFLFIFRWILFFLPVPPHSFSFSPPGSLSVSLAHTDSQPPAPLGTTLPPPSQLTAAGSTPAPSEAAWPGPPSPGCLWGAGEARPLSRGRA